MSGKWNKILHTKIVTDRGRFRVDRCQFLPPSVEYFKYSCVIAVLLSRLKRRAEAELAHIATCPAVFLVGVHRHQLNYPFQFNTLVINTNNITTNTFIWVGVYDLSGNRRVHWDNLPYNRETSYATAPASGGSVNLQPGYYYWAAALANNQSSQSSGGLAYSGTGGVTEPVRPWNTQGTVRNGTAANLMSVAFSLLRSAP